MGEPGCVDQDEDNALLQRFFGEDPWKGFAISVLHMKLHIISHGQNIQMFSLVILISLNKVETFCFVKH